MQIDHTVAAVGGPARDGEGGLGGAGGVGDVMPSVTSAGGDGFNAHRGNAGHDLYGELRG